MEPFATITDAPGARVGVTHVRHEALVRLLRFPTRARVRNRMPMQQAIIEAGAGGQDVLGILPTGTGKSICYQLPALERHAALDHLTVIISPLVALMADQRDGLLRNHGIDTCVVINGTLSPLHRREAIDQVIYGEASMLLIAPEQLRNNTIRQALDSRKIGLWVFDEAHCISKWGHDFRPDYRYAVRCLKQIGGNEPPPQVLCVTATAKQSVAEDICTQIADVTAETSDSFDGGDIAHEPRVRCRSGDSTLQTRRSQRGSEKAIWRRCKPRILCNT